MALRADVDVALLARYWWVFALRGVLAITFGVLAGLMPELTLTALVLLFGSYAIIEGGFIRLAFRLRCAPGRAVGTMAHAG